MPEVGARQWCGQCRMNRTVVDTDVDVVLHGHIGGQYEEPWRWVLMDCGHQESWTVNP